MNDKDRLVLGSILRHCDTVSERIGKYGITEERFTSESDLADLLLMPLLQIGELVLKLSHEYRNEHPEIPWKQIKEFRNVIAHDYDGVILPWAWNDIENDLPILAEHCRLALSEYEG
jgi:uncharacterized protein with HEPN domain